MTRTPTFLALAAAAALAGCSNNNPSTGAADAADASNAAAPIELPPSITAAKAYRCADNRVVQVDWLSDNKSANIRVDKTAAPVHLTAPEPGQPMTAEGGYELSGTPSDASVRITVPGKAAQSCKA